MTPVTIEAQYRYLRDLLAEKTKNDAAALKSFDRCYNDVEEEAEELTFTAAMGILVKEFNDCLPEDAEELVLEYTE
jgi:hypothetical protein